MVLTHFACFHKSSLIFLAKFYFCKNLTAVLLGLFKSVWRASAPGRRPTESASDPTDSM